MLAVPNKIQRPATPAIFQNLPNVEILLESGETLGGKRSWQKCRGRSRVPRFLVSRVLRRNTTPAFYSTGEAREHECRDETRRNKTRQDETRSLGGLYRVIGSRISRAAPPRLFPAKQRTSYFPLIEARQRRSTPRACDILTCARLRDRGSSRS